MTPKQKIIGSSILGLALIEIWGIAQPARATVEGMAADVVGVIGVLAATIYAGVMPVMGKLLSTMLDYGDKIFTLPIAQTVISLSITLANAIILLSLVISVILIILQINPNLYNIKKTLSGLVMAVLLSNLSVVIVKGILELSNLLVNSVNALVGNSTMELVHSYIYTIFLITPHTTAPAGPSAPGQILSALIGFWVPYVYPNLGDALLDMFSKEFVPTITCLVVLLLLLWVVIKITITLLERNIWMLILTVFSPLVFALDLLPLGLTKNLSNSWFQNIVKWIFVLPIMQIALILVVSIWRSANVTEDYVTKFLLNQAQGIDTKPEQFFPFLLGMGILYFAARVPELIKVGGITPLSGLVATPMAAYKTAQKYAYQPIAGTLAGKTMLGKAAYATVGGASRQIRAGSWGKGLQTKALGYEAWRQRQTAGPLGMIFNPKGRAKKMEVETRLAQAPITSALDIQATNRALEPLNAAARTGFGKNWLDLSAKQRDELSGKDRGLKEKERTYNSAFNTMMWRAREGIKEQDPSEFDPVPLLKQAVERGKKPEATPKERGEGLLATARLVKIASNKNHPERIVASEALTALQPDLRESYGITTAKLLRKGPEKKPKELNIKLLVESAAGLRRASSLNSLGSDSIAKLSRLLDSGELNIPELKELLDSGDQDKIEEFLDDLDLSDDEQNALKTAVGPEGFSEGEIIARFNALPKAREDAGGDSASAEDVQIKLAAFIETLKEKGTPAAAAAAGTSAVPPVTINMENLDAAFNNWVQKITEQIQKANPGISAPDTSAQISQRLDKPLEDAITKIRKALDTNQSDAAREAIRNIASKVSYQTQGAINIPTEIDSTESAKLLFKLQERLRSPRP